ncbi:3-oxo-5-alpha-steroid 4-dehydrogenase-domain-containing protein [Globomyces pollinis-pini]|nr:3-oxo-5-alpha-steroid 4-dehydrogenase-domain-containing protein [Globomyces pollinis-pini]
MELLLYLEFYAFPILFLLSTIAVNAPYGKFARDGWGPQFNGKWSFFIFEAVSPLFFFYFWWISNTLSSVYSIFLCSLYMLHYIYRSIIFTYITPSMKPASLPIILSAIFFNSINGYNNGIATSQLSSSSSILLSILGTSLFIIGKEKSCNFNFVGLSINIHSDAHLRSLRSKPGNNPNAYYIPDAGFYKYVTAANYFGELVEWFGWSLLLYPNVAGLAFFFCTFANLVPRAMSTHQWYKQKFSEKYPKDRYVIIPFVF